MSKTKYTKASSPLSSASFREASADELRILIAVLENGALTKDELSKLTGASAPRCTAALALWEAEGVITPTPCDENGEGGAYINVIDDYSSYTKSDLPEPTSGEIAKTIRDENLSSLIEECAILLGKATLATQDVKHLTSLYSELALSPEYILSLAAYLKDKNKLSGYNLRREAEKLVAKDITTLEKLDGYIKERDSEIEGEWEIRRMLGIFNRSVSDTERKFFKRWVDEFMFSVEIIRLAYDMTVTATGGNVSLAYMDKILTGWHEADCKTVSDCTAHSASTKPEREEKRTRRRPKSEEPKPRYGDFDTNEAFKAALARSFTDDND